MFAPVIVWGTPGVEYKTIRFGQVDLLELEKQAKQISDMLQTIEELKEQVQMLMYAPGSGPMYQVGLDRWNQRNHPELCQAQPPPQQKDHGVQDDMFWR